jgi:hypothetical protein
MGNFFKSIGFNKAVGKKVRASKFICGINLKSNGRKALRHFHQSFHKINVFDRTGEIKSGLSSCGYSD